MRATDIAPLKVLRVAFLGTVARTLAAFDPALTCWFPSCPLYAMTGWNDAPDRSGRRTAGFVHAVTIPAGRVDDAFVDRTDFAAKAAAHAICRYGTRCATTDRDAIDGPRADRRQA
jgi:hypothetical protein